MFYQTPYAFSIGRGRFRVSQVSHDDEPIFQYAHCEFDCEK